MRKTIMLVDDDFKAVEKARKALEQGGFKVETAGNGLECLQKLHAGLKPKLIILEAAMPVMSGWKTIYELQKDPKLAKIKTVLYSHDESSSKHKEYLKVLENHYVPKEFTPKSIVKKVKQLLAG